MSRSSSVHQHASYKPIWPTVTWISPLKRCQHARAAGVSQYALRALACLFARRQLVHFVFVDVGYATLYRRVDGKSSEAAERRKNKGLLTGFAIFESQTDRVHWPMARRDARLHRLVFIGRAALSGNLLGRLLPPVCVSYRRAVSKCGAGRRDYYTSVSPRRPVMREQRWTSSWGQRWDMRGRF